MPRTYARMFLKRPFPSCFEPHYDSEAKCKVIILKISFHSYASKTNFDGKYMKTAEEIMNK